MCIYIRIYVCVYAYKYNMDLHHWACGGEQVGGWPHALFCDRRDAIWLRPEPVPGVSNLRGKELNRGNWNAVIILIYMCMYIILVIFIYTWINEWIHIYIYTYIHIYICVNTYMHIHRRDAIWLRPEPIPWIPNLRGNSLGKGYLWTVFFARAQVLGLCLFVQVNRDAVIILVYTFVIYIYILIYIYISISKLYIYIYIYIYK